MFSVRKDKKLLRENGSELFLSMFSRWITWVLALLDKVQLNDMVLSELVVYHKQFEKVLFSVSAGTQFQQRNQNVENTLS